MKFTTSNQLKVPKAFQDLQRYINLLQDSFEGVHRLQERTPERFLDFFNSFRMIYSTELTLEETVKKFISKNTMAAAQNLARPELLNKAKWIIEATPELMRRIDRMSRQSDEEDCLIMTHLVCQLMNQIKDEQDPETLLRVLPARLKQAYYMTQAFYPHDLLLEIIDFEVENCIFDKIIMTMKSDLKGIQL